MSWKSNIARLLAPEEFVELEKQKANIDLAVNQRVADVLFKMDPFEPLLKKYSVVFPDKWEERKPEDDLDTMGAVRLFMWAYGTRNDPNFKHLIDWLRNQQGNNTLRKAKNENEWFFGRAAVATLTLFVEEVGRLSSKYEEIMSRRDQSFDAHLPVGEY